METLRSLWLTVAIPFATAVADRALRCALDDDEDGEAGLP
jgi:hypothetical protein